MPTAHPARSSVSSLLSTSCDRSRFTLSCAKTLLNLHDFRWL